MRGLDDSTELLIRVGQTAGEQVKHGWNAFLNFAARDNVLEVALGLMSVRVETTSEKDDKIFGDLMWV